MIRNKTGVWGEIYAARLLRDKGYEIISSDWSCRLGEIDLVAEKGDMLCFVEVKARNVSSPYSPGEAVDNIKQTKIAKAASLFLKYYGGNKPSRFDVIEVLLDDSLKPALINHMENAFEL
ncbi:MAG: YraN family protein [Clostridiales bacterium]|nr:YraN family protein [Clostridiales bacterium]